MYLLCPLSFVGLWMRVKEMAIAFSNNLKLSIYEAEHY